MSTPLVTVIIPSTCELKRAALIQRAINSIEVQALSAKIIFVANGNRYDTGLLQQLRQHPGLRVEYIPIGNLPNACRIGRTLVDTPFFCFLDDDDELLPDALHVRLQVMQADSQLALVVANGYNQSEATRVLRVPHGELVNADPQLALIRSNWLASCGGLYRTESIVEADFLKMAHYCEWTMLAFHIIKTRKIFFLNQPTYIVHETANSLSKSLAFVEADVKVIREMLNQTTRPELRAALVRKLGGSLHNLSDRLFENKQFFRAWLYHLASLCYPGGFQHLSVTRKHLMPWRYLDKQ